MHIEIRGAGEHNLQDVDVTLGDGLTVVTGVSGSGKTSLLFDTLYHEARRRFLDVFSLGAGDTRLAPAQVEAIHGLGPAVAVGQNLLNRNPNSTLATASGLHPFFRLLYAHYGTRHCARCGEPLRVAGEDEIVHRLGRLAERGPLTVRAPLLRSVPGSHRTLLTTLAQAFGAKALLVDGERWQGAPLAPDVSHDLAVTVAHLDGDPSPQAIRAAVEQVATLGAQTVEAEAGGERVRLARAAVCAECGAWFSQLGPTHFHRGCPHCQGEGCDACGGTGQLPEAAAVRWQGLRLTEWMTLSVDAALERFGQNDLPPTAERLQNEIGRRLEALQRVGLGYVALDRPSPTLSRGESQRVRLAVVLTNRLEDMLHVLDEPTIGQHPADVARLMPAFRELAGPVVYVEHDRIAAAEADHAVDLGPGAGHAGGRVVYAGDTAGLWAAETPTGRYFSLRERVRLPVRRPPPERFLTIENASLRNLRGVDVPIPLGRLTAVVGVSGSGKSTLVEDVLYASLKEDAPSGCEALKGDRPKAVMVDQEPIGRNPRSNPATYTKLSNTLRHLYARHTGLNASCFSFNRPEGACPVCEGLGAIEVRMRYLPSTWIPCEACDGQRFKEEVLGATVDLQGEPCSIADLYDRSVDEVAERLLGSECLTDKEHRTADRILTALRDIGLGYLTLGQPSPTLSGGEAQRVKLARYLGRRSLKNQLLILDEPTTGLHPQDVAGLLTVLDRLVRSGATVVVVEHNTDLVRAADWVIELGPGAGPQGGRLLYAGPGDGLDEVDTPTALALQDEGRLRPRESRRQTAATSNAIRIRNARAHNLRQVDVDIPKHKLTVVTGVSGSGKSSLVGDVLEAEARRRFLESLSLYERQGTHEGAEAPVDEVSGLGVAVTVTPEGRLRNHRATVGTATEIGHHLAGLLATAGERYCSACGEAMARETRAWHCPSCGATASLARPRHFMPHTYSAACTTCNGVGTLRKPVPEKLIVHPERPLCDGAMHSPGFFPQGYLCKPFNGGYDMVQALAQRYRFDPARTPWNEMTPEAQEAFLFGDDEPMTVHYESRTGRRYQREQTFPGFYGWIRDWDTGGTYTTTELCPDCRGAKLRPEYLAVTLAGENRHTLSQMPLGRLADRLATVTLSRPLRGTRTALVTALRRLRFLEQVGVGYLHLDRATDTLSAGEAQRIKLAGLLGSELTSLTILLDEPTRGLHPSEVQTLAKALEQLRDQGNTVVVVEHDPGVMRAADHLIDMGPGAGTAGGRIVAQGTPEQVVKSESLTADWLTGRRRPTTNKPRREPKGWLTLHGACEHNLRGDPLRLPLGVLVGVCGVSGSGKSTLIVDTLARILAPRKHTTSVARESLEPGRYDRLEGESPRTVVVDQARRGIGSPARYLGLLKPLAKAYAESEDAQILELDAKQLTRRCSACKGRGQVATDMGFLPDVYEICEICRGSGLTAEAWEVRLQGLSLPQVYDLTLDQVRERFGQIERIERSLQAACDVGLGYLVMQQPGYSLSGGEIQRLKIAAELARRTTPQTLYILDEPTVGQHLEDVSRLASVLQRLVDAGHTVLVVEHHAHLLSACDWLIELGPGGGPEGGAIVGAGTPETLAAGGTPTALYLREILEAAP